MNTGGYRFLGPAVDSHGKKNTEFNIKSKVTCTNANQVYAVGDVVTSIGGSTIVDGTRKFMHAELIITLNDYTAKTGSDESVTVYLLRTNSNDGTATTSLSTADKVIVDKFGMDAASVVRYPVIEYWSVKNFKIATDTAGAVFQVTLKGVYKE